MKQIIETKMVEQTTVTFVADDGKVFTGNNAEKECKEHERRLDTDKLKRKFEKLKREYIRFPFGDFSGNDEYYIVHLNDENDLQTVVDYEAGMNSRWFDDYVSEQTFAFPCDVLIQVTESYIDAYDEETIQNCINELKEATIKLENFAK